MSDDDILNKGGTQDDVDEYARQNGAELTKEDFITPVMTDDIDKRLDKILKTFAITINGDSKTGFTLDTSDAKQAILLAHQKEVERIIGENVELSGKNDIAINLQITIENSLRTEQLLRANIKEDR